MLASFDCHRCSAEGTLVHCNQLLACQIESKKREAPRVGHSHWQVLRLSSDVANQTPIIVVKLRLKLP